MPQSRAEGMGGSPEPGEDTDRPAIQKALEFVGSVSPGAAGAFSQDAMKLALERYAETAGNAVGGVLADTLLTSAVAAMGGSTASHLFGALVGLIWRQESEFGRLSKRISRLEEKLEAVIATPLETAARMLGERSPPDCGEPADVAFLEWRLKCAISHLDTARTLIEKLMPSNASLLSEVLLLQCALAEGVRGSKTFRAELLKGAASQVSRMAVEKRARKASEQSNAKYFEFFRDNPFYYQNRTVVRLARRNLIYHGAAPLQDIVSSDVYRKEQEKYEKDRLEHEKRASQFGREAEMMEGLAKLLEEEAGQLDPRAAGDPGWGRLSPDLQ